jgi:hypothetical protein
MIAHKYGIGEFIAFRRTSRLLSAATGDYQVVAHRPISDGEPWYVIRSELERHDRVAAEGELATLRLLPRDDGASASPTGIVNLARP